MSPQPLTLDDAPDVLSLRQAAGLLGVSHETVRRMVQRDDLPTVRLPGVDRTVIPKWAVAELIPQPASLTPVDS